MFFKSNLVLSNNENMAVLDADQDEFLSICNFLRDNAELYSQTGLLPFESIRETMLESGYIPCVFRGKDTEELFRKYDVNDKYMAIMLADPEHMIELFKQAGGQVEEIL